MFSTVGYAPISSSAPRPLGAAYVPILLSEVKQEQRPCGNRDREAIVVGAGLCDGEGERSYTEYDSILGEEKYLIYFKRFAEAKTGYGTICRKTINQQQHWYSISDKQHFQSHNKNLAIPSLQTNNFRES